MDKLKLEFIWLDGYNTPNLRAKTKIIEHSDNNALRLRNLDFKNPENIPEWSFDGSSTQQATGDNSDCILKPVKVVHNHFDDDLTQRQIITESLLVLCEVFNADDTPHKSNTRAKLQQTNDKYQKYDMQFGFEQEFVIYEDLENRPYNWPLNGFPAEQGRYYCGVGGDVAWGRKILDDFIKIALLADLQIGGINAEVMPSQWEFQVGPLSALEVSDQLWLARYILNRVAEQHNANIKLDSKPIAGDWNGNGNHLNFSTAQMREDCPQELIKRIGKELEECHDEHIKEYGLGNELRLTGQHETCNINEFKIGVSDRTASIRIPINTFKNKKGHMEDRRPSGTVDPYRACNILMKSVCEAEKDWQAWNTSDLKQEITSV